MAKILQFIRKLRLPDCSICDRAVKLESEMIDQNRKIVHRDCYARIVRLKEITPPRSAS